VKLVFTRVRDVKRPERSGKNAGIDFFIPNDWNDQYYIRENESVLIPSGIKIKLPENHCLIAFNKSGIATKHSLQVGACVVDENYTGEIHLHLMNVGKTGISVKAGQKILQFVLIKQEYVNLKEVDNDTIFNRRDHGERGDNGFGSTGE
jgi:dUTP pyrophosphatase